MVLFSIPTFVWSAVLILHGGKQNQNMELQWEPQHPLKYFWVGKLACKFVSPPHLCKPTQPAKICMCTKINRKFFKTQNALESLKFELLSLWCLNCKSEYLWVLTLPGTKKGFLVQISFSVLAGKIKGDLGEKSSTKKPSSSLAVSVSLKPKFWIFSIFAFAILRQKKMFTASHLVLDVTKKSQTTNQQKQINKQTALLKGASQVFILVIAFFFKFYGILLQLWIVFFSKKAWIFRHRSHITDRD